MRLYRTDRHLKKFVKIGGVCSLTRLLRTMKLLIMRERTEIQDLERVVEEGVDEQAESW